MLLERPSVIQRGFLSGHHDAASISRSLWKRYCFRYGLGVFAEHAEDFALDADAGGGGVDGSHFGVGGLEADEVAFAVEALEGGVRAVDQGDDDFAFAGGAGSFHEHVIPRDDVFVAHGVTTDFEGVDLAVADDVA